MRRPAALGVTLAISAASMAAAQGPPPSDIYLAPLALRNGQLTVGHPTNVTRRPGYDNQPSFAPDGTRFYYTSHRGGQADIFVYDIAANASERVTATPESEYSPTVMPGGTRFSVVRVEADSTQRLWSFALDGSDPRIVLTDVAPVGYHAWLDSNRVALFVLGSPNTLQVHDVQGGRPAAYAADIGRTLAPVPGSNKFSYVQRGDAGENVIVVLDARGTAYPLIPTPRHDFFAWTPDGQILTAAGGVVYVLSSPGKGEGWTELVDFTAQGIIGITRLAVSPRGDLLAIVATATAEQE